MRDSGSGDLEDIARMQAVALAAGTDVLAASRRSPEDVVALAERGITAFTVSPALLQRMLSSEATVDANSAFAAAASLVGVHDGLVSIRGTACLSPQRAKELSCRSVSMVSSSPASSMSRASSRRRAVPKPLGSTCWNFPWQNRIRPMAP